MNQKLLFSRNADQAEYRSCLWILFINPVIFIWAALAAYGATAQLQFGATFLLTPLGIFALQYTRRERIGQRNPKWLSEFVTALAFSCAAVFWVYRQIWTEYQMLSGTYSSLMLICFYWSDAVIKLLKLKTDK